MRGELQPPPPPAVVDGKDEYQVECSIDVRKVRRGRGYRQDFLVRWLGDVGKHASYVFT
jgi:hypothetical protein